MRTRIPLALSQFDGGMWSFILIYGMTAGHLPERRRRDKKVGAKVHATPAFRLPFRSFAGGCGRFSRYVYRTARNVTTIFLFCQESFPWPEAP